MLGILWEKVYLVAVYNYSPHKDLNLVLGKCSKVPEIHVVLDSLKHLEVFTKTMLPI